MELPPLERLGAVVPEAARDGDGPLLVSNEELADHPRVPGEGPLLLEPVQEGDVGVKGGPRAWVLAGGDRPRVDIQVLEAAEEGVHVLLGGRTAAVVQVQAPHLVHLREPLPQKNILQHGLPLPLAYLCGAEGGVARREEDVLPVQEASAQGGGGPALEGDKARAWEPLLPKVANHRDPVPSPIQHAEDAPLQVVSPLRVRLCDGDRPLHCVRVLRADHGRLALVPHLLGGRPPLNVDVVPHQVGLCQAHKLPVVAEPLCNKVVVVQDLCDGKGEGVLLVVRVVSRQPKDWPLPLCPNLLGEEEPVGGDGKLELVGCVFHGFFGMTVKLVTKTFSKKPSC